MKGKADEDAFVADAKRQRTFRLSHLNIISTFVSQPQFALLLSERI